MYTLNSINPFRIKNYAFKISLYGQKNFQKFTIIVSKEHRQKKKNSTKSPGTLFGSDWLSSTTSTELGLKVEMLIHITTSALFSRRSF
jgi:hypothetical protein